MKKEKLVILVVDDSPAIVQRLTNMLNEMDTVGHVLQANSYDEALASLLSNHPSILLLDINLRGRSGIDLLRAIRENNLGPKVMMVSNHSEDSYRKRCSALGAYYFFDKADDFYKIPGIILQVS